MPTQESKVHRTPRGGVRSTIYYQDADGNPTDKKRAVRAEIVEYDGRGNVVGRTYGTIGGEEEGPVDRGHQ